MTIDEHTLDKACEWSVEILDLPRPQHSLDKAIAAAEVIQSLPDEWIDTSKLREVVDNIAAATGGFPPEFQGKLRTWHRLLQALLPAPTPQVEIALGAWAMHPKHGKVLILSEHIDRDGEVCITWEGLESFHSEIGRWVPAADLSPVPDTHDDSDPYQGSNCQGILNSSPEPQPGEAWLIRKENGDCREAVLDNEGEWNGTYDNGEYHVWWKDVTPLRRLVPAQEPRKLTSFRDYKSAIVGTVVRDGSDTTTKEGHGYWRDTDGIEYTDGDMAGVTSTVLWEPDA